MGRALMQHLLDRETQRRVPGVRLVQTAYHYRSLALYAKLGFQVREPLAVLQGRPPRVVVPGRQVRPATTADLPACAGLCQHVHGFDRTREVQDAITDTTAVVVERDGRVTGYATGFGYGRHAVASTDDDLKALLGSAEAFVGLGFLLPARNTTLLGWCLAQGLRVVQTSTLMTLGDYREPAGAWLPSILF